MVLGMSLSAFTLLHVIISLAGIGSGFVVVYGLLNGTRLDSWTAIFLTTTVLTSLTGFLFPFEGLKPSYIVGGISLVVLAIAIWGAMEDISPGPRAGSTWYPLPWHSISIVSLPLCRRS
jgi:hypothetical protein